jgi:hypothetical protein
MYFHCEWNEFGQKVLKYYWPKAITYNDITKTDFSIHRGTIDILTADSLVNHTHPQESDSVKRMRDTSGLRCLEQFGRFNRPGLWAKTFVGLLIGTEGWYSTRCKLIWKLKATKSHRFYFQLVPSTLPTEGTEFGLLPTPLAQAREQKSFDKYDQRMERLVEKGHKPFTMPLDQMALRGLLPTPTASDKNGREERECSEGTEDTIQ